MQEFRASSRPVSSRHACQPFMKSSDQRNYGFVLYAISLCYSMFYNYFRYGACATSQDNGRRFDVNKCPWRPAGPTATALAVVRRVNASTETSESDYIGRIQTRQRR